MRAPPQNAFFRIRLEVELSKVAMFASALMLATAAFRSVILTDPPTAHAAVGSGAERSKRATVDHSAAARVQNRKGPLAD